MQIGLSQSQTYRCEIKTFRGHNSRKFPTYGTWLLEYDQKILALDVYKEKRPNFSATYNTKHLTPTEILKYIYLTCYYLSNTEIFEVKNFALFAKI